MDTISNIPKKIFNFFSQKAEELGKTSGFKQRNSKLTPKAFLKEFISCCFSGNFTLEMFCAALKNDKIDISKQALFERFNERTAAFIKSMASMGLKYFTIEKLPQVNLLLNQFTAVNIIDSSSVSLHKALSQIFKGSGGAASTAALKIQVMFDFISGQIKEVELTSGCDNDQGFDKFLDSIEEGALYLMDLGYFKLASFNKIIKGKAFFISRFLTGTKLLDTEKKPLDLLSFLSSSGEWVERQLLLGTRAKIPVRFIAQRLPDELANRRRQKLKEGHRRRGRTPSDESLALQSWSIHITNTTEEQISYKEIYQTYALRWQIELIFKLSKSLMHIDLIKAQKSYRVIIETYGKFICMIILFFLCAPIRFQKQGEKPKEISFYKACKMLINRFAQFTDALASFYRLNRFIKSFYEDLSLFAIKDIKRKTPSLSKTMMDGAF